MSNTTSKNVVIYLFIKSKQPHTEACEPLIFSYIISQCVLSTHSSLLGIKSEAKTQFQGLKLDFLFF